MNCKGSGLGVEFGEPLQDSAWLRHNQSPASGKFCKESVGVNWKAKTVRGKRQASRLF